MKEIQNQTKSGLAMAAPVVCLGALLVTGCKFISSIGSSLLSTDSANHTARSPTVYGDYERPNNVQEDPLTLQTRFGVPYKTPTKAGAVLI